MTITADSRFASLRLSPDHSPPYYWGGFEVVLDDATDTTTATRWYLYLEAMGGLIQTGDLATLRILQDIYASDDGFLDADGNAVEVTVQEGLGFESLADYEDAGLVHPLTPGFPDCVYVTRQVGIDVGCLTTRSTNPDGHVTHVESMSKIPGYSSPDGDTMTYSLAGWTTRLYTGNQWQIVYDYVEADGITLTNRHDQPEWKSLLAFLEAHRTSGPEVPQDLDTTASDYNHLDPLGGAQFAFTPSGGTQQTFVVTRFSWTLGPSDANWVTELICEVTAGTGSTYNQADYANYIQTREVTIGAIEDSIAPVWGSHTVPVRARNVDLPNNLSLGVQNEQVVVRLANGLDVPVLGDTGTGVSTALLDNFPGNTADWHMARPPITVVHHSTSTGTDRAIRLWDPRTVLPAGSHISQWVHNSHPSQHGDTLTLQDWDGNVLFTLRPTQLAQYRVTHRSDGVGEVIVTRLPTRIHYQGGSNIGTLGVNKIDWSSTLWAIPIPVGGTATTDTDTIRIGNTAYADEAAWSAVAHEELPGSITPLRPGQIEIDVRLEIAAPLSGLIDAGWQTELRGYRGGNDFAVGGTTRTHQSFGGIGQRRIIHVIWRGVAPTDVVYKPIMRWSKSSTMDLANVSAVSHQRDIRIDPLIEVETS